MTQGRPTTIPELRFVGTTWYDRGWRYWWRRFWLSLFYFLLMLLFAAVIGILISAMVSLIPSTPGRFTLCLIIAIAIMWSCASTYAKLSRTPEDRAAHRPVHWPSEEISWDETNRIPAGFSVMGPAVAFVAPLLMGGIIGIFATSLGRYLHEEEWRLARKYGVEDRINAGN